MHIMLVIRVVVTWISAASASSLHVSSPSIYPDFKELLSPFRITKWNSFRVFWNVPSFSCHKYGIKMNVSSPWGIIQNADDAFRGERLTILYDPGDMPALIKDSSGKLTIRNGGAPQEGNLRLHLQALENYVDRNVKDKNFSGLGVIDMESWRPVFRQLFGSFTPYKEFSYNIERHAHPKWPQSKIEKEAKSRFESAARKFMENTIEMVRQMRPHGQWGYYAFPYCFNSDQDSCPKIVKTENDGIQWLFDESNALYPSIYLGEQQPVAERAIFMRGRLQEARRVAGRTPRLQDPAIYAYIRYNYHDTSKFLSYEDLFNSFNIPKNLQLDGVIIWGSSNDLNSPAKCHALQDYINTVLGPIVRDMLGRTNVP